jgi:ribose transport system substrate-binding protein
MSRRLKWVALAALAALCVVFTACGSSDDGGGGATSADTGAATTAEETPAADDAATSESEATGAVPDDPDAADFEGATPGSGDGVKIGYISLGDQVPFVKLVSDGIKDQARRAGANLVFCDSQVDAAKALDCAKNFKTQNVDVIVNFQVDEKAAPNICAAGPDVPTIAVDINQRPCQVSFMGANNLRAGEIAGTAMGEYFRSNDNCEYDAVVSMQQPSAGVVNEQRSGGALRAFETVCGEVEDSRLKIVDGGGTIEGGQRKFADVLTSLPGQSKIIVLSLNDDMALGALAAARSQGRERDLYLAGQGADPSAHCEIANNPQWVGDAAYFPERYGEILVPNAIRAARGEEVPATLFVPHTLVTADNISEYYQVRGC